MTSSQNAAERHDEREVRLGRLTTLRERGIDPYPARTKRTHTTAAVLSDWDNLTAIGSYVTLAGRLKAIRGHGKSCFADLEDGSGKIQIHLKADLLGPEGFTLFSELLDRGDFIEAEGAPFVTKMGEKSVEVSRLALLSKAIAPLPDKFHGLSDVEIRYRRRELDLVSNAEVRRIFEVRSAIIRAVRDFLVADGFMEVETPMLQPLAGGATARPFVTHHNALDTDLFLRVAPELYLKKVIVGGFERVFEIGRCFRNEGIDHSHNPEFTMLEYYQAYADYGELMAKTEAMLPTIVRAATGGHTNVRHGDDALEFAGPYQRISFRDALLEHAGVNLDTERSRDSLAAHARRLGVPVEPSDDVGKLIDNIYKKTVRQNIVQPTFVTDHPVELSPLAKRHASDPRYVERFQLVVGRGAELVNAFSELNDPIDQLSRFEEQEQLRAAGDDEAHQIDHSFIDALEVGMPPTAGLGMGIDRLTALLTGAPNLKEVILFPTLRPLGADSSDAS